MSETYTNPFAGLPDTNFPNNPFWSGVKSGEREAMMAPFRGMEQERQGIALQKSRMDMGEYSSPEAQALRLQTIKGEGKKKELEFAQTEAAISRLPQEEKVRLVELRNKMDSAEAAPFKPFLEFMSTAAAELQGVPEPMKAAAWASKMKLLESTHPGIKIPDQFRNYSPETLQQAVRIRSAATMTPEFIQKMELEKQKESGALERVRIQAGATTGAAAIHEQGAMAREKFRADTAAKQTPGQFKVQNMRTLTDPNSTPEQIEVAEANLQSFAADNMQKLYQNDPLLQALAIKALSDPTAAAQIDARKSKLFEDHLTSEGIRVKVKSPDGKVGTIPKSKLRGALAAGYSEVK